MSKIEAEVRHQIDRRLEAKGWILDASHPDRNVFFERAFVDLLGSLQRKALGAKSPDYTFFSNGRPMAILEAKKESISIQEALDQAENYAKRIGVDYVFACNGPAFKSRHIPTQSTMMINGLELVEPPSVDMMNKYVSERSFEIFTVSKKVVRSRDDLIQIFEKLNDVLRQDGITAGVSRFTEFANILFLKLLSEQESENGIWNDLVSKPEKELPNYLNNYAIKQLKNKYGNEVLSDVTISGKSIKAIVNELNPLDLLSVGDDVKGAAFEHFLSRTTASTNDLGEYFTPRKVIQFILNLVNPQFGQTIYDPFCGTGGFLIQAFSHLRQQVSPTKDSMRVLCKESIYGQEQTSTARIAKMNMILFGDGHSGVMQGDSLSLESQNPSKQYDYILSNIPFSLNRSKETIISVHPDAKDSDEACLLHCFNKLKTGGSMGVILPEGLIFNKPHREMWNRIFNNSRVRVIASLPRGTFSPYTEAATKVLYLTDKGTASTDWYYDVVLTGEKTSGVTINPDDFLYFYQDTEHPLESKPGVYLAKPKDGFIRTWNNLKNINSFPLSEVADIQKGKMLTKRDAIPGDISVIGGGSGVIACTHNESNHEGGCFTISGSGAYSGYAWWHENALWASDCLVVRSKNESVFSSFYLYMCVKALQEELYSRQHGTGQPHIYKEHIWGLPIPELPLDKQQALTAKTLDAMKKRMIAERAENTENRLAVDKIVKIMSN